MNRNLVLSALYDAQHKYNEKIRDGPRALHRENILIHLDIFSKNVFVYGVKAVVMTQGHLPNKILNTPKHAKRINDII
jgi:hypothetical protein